MASGARIANQSVKKFVIWSASLEVSIAFGRNAGPKLSDESQRALGRTESAAKCEQDLTMRPPGHF